MKKKLQIKLMSDLCAGSGASFGSLIDTDICYDTYGLPYIPSKRIKGLFKEAFTEYALWKANDAEESERFQKQKDQLFGIGEERNSCHLRIDNAYLPKAEKIEEEISQIEDRYQKYLTKQRVMGLNTDVRYQTAVELESGVAKENSLRNIRVFEAGNILEAQIECETYEELELLRKCAKWVTHMGNNRTRGFGEVVCTILDLPEEAKEEKPLPKCEEEKEYQITLILKAESDLMVSKQFSEQSQSYIPGSNVMGAIAGKYRKEHPLNEGETLPAEYIAMFLEGSVTYANAYITEKEGAISYYPTPLSYAREKDQKGIYHNGMLEIQDKNIQLLKLQDQFVSLDENNYSKEVFFRENYHHQRPKNFSIGHVSKEPEGGTFYQFLSIEKGQFFRTVIRGKGKYLNPILGYIAEDEILRVGKSRTAEYGKLRVQKCIVEEREKKEKPYQKFAVILTSPMILLNEENLQMARDKKILVKAIQQTLGICQNPVKEFIGYAEESGFNMIWKLVKEQVPSFAAGSVLVFELEKPIYLQEEYILGERTNEGYGQMRIYDLAGKTNSQIHFKEYIESTRKLSYSELQEETRKLLNQSIRKVLKEQILANALKEAQNTKLNHTTINRVLLMLKESNREEEWKENVKSMKDKKKLEQITKMLENKESLMNFPAYQDYAEALSQIGEQIPEEEKEAFTLESIKQFFTILKIKGGEERC